MEKNILEWALVPVLALMGWMERKKVDRNEWLAKCNTTHAASCEKMNLIHEDIKYMRERLDAHIDK